MLCTGGAIKRSAGSKLREENPQSQRRGHLDRPGGGNQVTNYLST